MAADNNSPGLFHQRKIFAQNAENPSPDTCNQKSSPGEMESSGWDGKPKGAGAGMTVTGISCLKDEILQLAKQLAEICQVEQSEMVSSKFRAIIVMRCRKLSKNLRSNVRRVI